MTKCSYAIVKTLEGVVWIEDRNIGRSVTNDAENVVEELNEKFPGYRIIYKDSTGSWGELKHDDGVFIGFAPVKKEEEL